MERSLSVPTLLRLAPFLPGESLLSRLLRLAKINHCDSLSLLSSLIFEKSERAEGTRDNLGRPGHRETYELLATLTKSKVEELYAATVHTFAPVLTPPDRRVRFLELLDTLVVPVLENQLALGHLHPERAGQFCPLCLQEEASHHLGWMPLASAVCLRHHCFLVSRCPQCRKNLSVTEIVAARCRACATSLTRAQKEAAMMDDFGLFTQRLIQAWFLSGTPCGQEDYLLPRQPVRVLYRVLTGLRLLLLKFSRTAWPYLSAIAPIEARSRLYVHRQVRPASERYAQYAAAFKVLANWPEGFFDFLDVCRSQSDKGRLSKRYGETDFGDIYSYWMRTCWKHPDFRFVQDAFDEYVFEKCRSSQWVLQSHRYRTHPRFAKDFNLLGITEAAKLLDASPQTIKVLLQTGQLSPYQEQSSHQYKKETFFNRSEVLALHEKRKDRVSLAEAAKFLGVSQQRVHDLISVGLLRSEQGVALKAGGFLTKSALLACLEQIARGVQIDPECHGNEKDLPLREAAHLASSVGLNAAEVLLQVAQGQFHACHHAGSQFQLGSLRFRRVDVQAWIDGIKAENHWMGPEAVMAFLKVEQTYTKWLKAGLISPVAVFGHIKYYDRRLIEQFRSDYLLSEEAADLLGIKRTLLYQWIHRGWLDETFLGGERTHYYLFSRQRLLQWRHEQVVSSEEAAHLLGREREALWSLVRTGKLTPLLGTRKKPYWFWRQAILEWQSTAAQEAEAAFSQQEDTDAPLQLPFLF